MRRMFAALAAILAAIPKLAWNAASQTWEVVKGTAGAAVGLGAALVEDVISLPGAILAAFAPKQEPTPAQAAQAAVAAAQAAEKTSEEDDKIHRQAAGLRRCAAAKGRGEKLEGPVLEGCPPGAQGYLEALTQEQCRTLGAAPMKELKRMMSDSLYAPRGVPSVAELVIADHRRRDFEPEAEADPAKLAKRAAAREAVRRAATRAAMPREEEVYVNTREPTPLPEAYRKYAA